MNCIYVQGKEGSINDDKPNSVNASACEFLAEILKQVQNYPIIANKISHLIVRPLIGTFNESITHKKEAA